MRTRLLLPAILFALPVDAAAQSCTSKPHLGTIAGTVTDRTTSLPLANVKVSVSSDGSKRDVRTDGAGAFLVCDVTPGMRVLVNGEFMGRKASAAPLELTPGDSSDIGMRIDAPQARIDGRVLDHGSGRPIVAAAISFGAGGPSRVSDDDGRFQLDVPPGRFPVQVTHVAYTGISDSLGVEFGTLSKVTVNMLPNVIPLDAIEVDVRSLMLERNGFYDRQARGQGSFIMRRDFEMRNPHAASDILRMQAGLRIVPRRFGRSSVVVGRGNCPFRYFMDGVRVSDTFQIDDIPAEWIEAIEIYRGPSSVPMQFMLPPSESNANCGIIAIWTRIRD
jgi:hypothetical protein